MTREQSIADAAQMYADEVSPDSMMGDFRGRSLFGLLAFTVIVHVGFVGVFSIRYLKNEVLGEDTSTMSQEERVDSAVREATTSLREIAERHGVNPQDLSDRFAKGDSRPTSTARPQPEILNVQDKPPVSDESDQQEPKSAIEDELQKKVDGPDLPDLPPLEQEDDLFR